MFVHLTLALNLLAICVIAGVGGLAQLKFTSVLAASVSERLTIITSVLAQDFGTVIDLGLGLSEVGNGEVILDRARRRDPNIRSIAVFGLDGRIVHAVGATRGERVGNDIMTAFRLAQTGIAAEGWSVEHADRVVSGSLIVGSFGRPVGGVVAEVPTADMREESRRMAGRLIRSGAWIALGTCGLVSVLLAAFRARRPTPGPSLSDGTLGPP